MGAFGGYNGLVIPCLASPFTSLLFPQPYPPYNPSPSGIAAHHVLFMIVTPFTPDFWALFLILQGFFSLLWISVASSSHLSITTCSTKTHHWYPHPNLRTSIPSSTFHSFNPHGRIFLTSLTIKVHVSSIYSPSWIC